MNAQNVAPSSAAVIRNTALISEVSTPNAAPAPMGTLLVAMPPRADRFPEDAPVPIAAGSILNTDYVRQVDPTYRGIKLDSEPSRIVQNSPENMERLRRVFDHSEVDPYTGKRVDYYRQLPPEENKDYRLPRETMNQVNRRMIAIQGYDHTKPKPQRTERLADAPQPDGRFDEAANYTRILNEMQERVSRDLVNNKKGERPAWTRETQRAFGYNGYQDMSRYVPDLPPTLRADTEPMKPSTDQVNNPNPNKELEVRGAYRDDAKTPHTGQVDWRNHAKSVDTDKPAFKNGVEQRVQDGTYRGDQDGQGFQPGPVTLDNGMPRIGEAHDPRRKLQQTTDFAMRTSHSLNNVGASDAMANRVLTRILDQVGKQNAGNRNFTDYAQQGVMYPQSMKLNSATAGSDGANRMRGDYSVGTNLTFAAGRQPEINLPPVINVDPNELPEIKRASYPEKQYQTFASSRLNEFSLGNAISRNTDLVGQNRPGQLDVLGLKMAQSDAQFAEPAWISTQTDQMPKRADAYGQDAGSRRNGAAVGELGTLQIGRQEIMQVSGKRAETGNISATQYLHGGGVGMAFREPGMFNRETFLSDGSSNRTYQQDFTALRQAANRTMQPM
jgi:hypothetical protein